MAIITKITTQQKNKDRFNIFMDYGKGNGEEFAFSIDSDVLIRFQLKKGMELDDFSFMEIQYQDDIRKAYNLAVHYLSRRIRSEKEIRDYLLQKEVDNPIIDEVIHKLIAQKYINDQEYAFAFVRTQANTTDKGPDLIRLELREKGINEQMIKEALSEYPLEQQIEKALKLSQKLLQKNSKDSERIAKQKLENSLLRKGYSYEVIKIASEEFEGTKAEDEEMQAIRYQGEKLHRKYMHLNDFEYQQKMKQSLFRKGFSIELIDQYLDEVEKS